MELDRVRESKSRLLATVSGLDGSALRGPSLLPGWSRAHVVVHLARNADAQLRMIDGALRGASVEQYAGGEQGRAREIEEGATADVEAIVAGLVSSVSALERRWATLPEQAWDLETVTLRFRRTVREGIAARWRLVAQDTMRTWRVDAASVQPGAGAADVEVSGSGWQLLAWLVCRGDHGLKVVGRADRLPDLPAYG